MNKREMQKFEKTLLAERERLVRGIRKLEEDTLYQPASDNTADLTSYAEVGTDNFDRETALNIASTEAERLREVNEALGRIKDGTFGICGSCNAEIPKKRIEFYPAARHCVECQSKIEKSGSL